MRDSCFLMRFSLTVLIWFSRMWSAVTGTVTVCAVSMVSPARLLHTPALHLSPLVIVTPYSVLPGSEVDHGSVRRLPQSRTVLENEWKRKCEHCCVQQLRHEVRHRQQRCAEEPRAEGGQVKWQWLDTRQWPVPPSTRPPVCTALLSLHLQISSVDM